ncbi:MAG: MMPL family transporter, partial [Gemmataceae bacterium]
MSPDSSTPTQVVRRYLIALVEQVCRRPWLVVTVAVGLAIASLLAAFTHLHYQTSRDDLVSGRKEYKQRWDRYVAEFGEDDDIVVVVQGEDRERMKQAVDAVAGRLASHPLLFDRLFHKVDLRPLRDRALLLAPMDKVQTIHGEYLADMKRLLDFGPISWHTLGVHPMVQEARQRLADIRPNDKLSRSDERFLAQLGPIARAATEAIQDPRCYRNPWGGLPGMDDQRQNVVDEPQYFFSGDQTLAFLLARPVKEAGSFTGARKSVATAREIVNEVQPNFPDLRLGLTGLPVLETDEMVAAETDTRLASYLAIAGVSLLFLLVYRSIAYPLLTVATLLVGTAWAFGWLTLTVGHLNILSATFAVMLIGMGDYGVLWVIRYEQARQGGMEVREALLHTTEHVAIGNLTAASTLALAFFAALFADFKAVGELGWIAGCGVLLCAFACFTFLPAMLTLFDRRGALTADPERAAVVPCSGDLWLPWLRRHPGVVLATGLTAALSLAACAVRVRYDHNLLNLQADNLDSVKWERTLIDHTAGASWHSLSYCANVEETQALAERFKRLPEVSQVVEVASLVPADQKAKLPLLADIQKQLTRLPQRGTRPRHATPDILELRSDLEQLNRTLAERTGDSQLLRELLAEMRKLARTLEDSAPDTTADRLRVVDERLSEDLASGLHRLRDVSTPRPISLADLPPSVRERYVGHNGSFLLRVFAREDLWDFPPLEEFTRKIQ